MSNSRQKTERRPGLWSVLGAAAAAASAVESGRRPRRADLVTLGIAPDAFDRIG